MTSDRALVLQHDICALEGPRLDSEPVALLRAGAAIPPGAAEQGFLRLAGPSGAGYVPLALCGTAPAAPTRVVQPVALGSTPADAGAAELVMPDEPLEFVAQHGRFTQVIRADGTGGFVPSLLLHAVSPAPGRRHVKQAVRFYVAPVIGGQSQGARSALVMPDDPLLLLGEHGASILVQRADGRIGFIPAALAEGRRDPEVLLRVGPIDLGYIALGLAWGIVNLAGVWVMLSWLVTGGAHTAVAATVAAAAVATMVARGRSRVRGRSFGIGVLLAFALIALSGKIL